MQFNIGIDIGASTVRMAVRGRGIVFRQSSAIAMHGDDVKPLAIGNEALLYIGRAPSSVTVARPMNGGLVIRDDLMTRWLSYLLETATAAGLVSRPRVLLVVDPEVQSAATLQMATMAVDAGASTCAAIRSDLMAALGAGLDIRKPEASLVLDVGASRISVSLITHGRVAYSETLPFGMQRVNEAILRILRVKHGLMVGAQVAEEVKLQLCSAIAGRGELSMNVTGMKPLTGFPAMAAITASEVAGVAAVLVESIGDLAASVIDHAPVELAADLNDSGIALTGGGAQLFGLDKLVAEKTGLACHVMEDPANCAIRGLSLAMDKPEAFSGMIDASMRRLERKLPTPAPARA